MAFTKFEPIRKKRSVYKEPLIRFTSRKGKTAGIQASLNQAAIDLLKKRGTEFCFMIDKEIATVAFMPEKGGYWKLPTKPGNTGIIADAFEAAGIAFGVYQLSQSKFPPNELRVEGRVKL